MQNDNNPFPPTPDVNETKNPIYKSRTFIIGVITLVLILLSAAAFMLFKPTVNQTNPTKSTEEPVNRQFTGSGAMIGSFKSIGACNFLAYKDIDTSFGAEFIKPLRNMTEAYYDISTPSPRIDQGEPAATSTCRYQSIGQAEEATNIRVAVIQYASLDEKNKRILRASDILVASSAELNDIETKYGAKLTAEGKSFLQEVKKNNEMLTKNIYEDPVKVASLLKDKVIMSSVGKSGYEFGFEQYHSNYVVNVDARAGTAVRSADTLTEADYIRMINGIAGLSKTISEASKNDATIRQPAPTSNDKIVPGEAKLAIKDACNVITPQVYEDFAGFKENEPLVRETFPELEDSDIKNDDVNINRFTSVCERRYSAAKLSSSYTKSPAEQALGNAATLDIKVEIAHAKNAAVIEKSIKPFRDDASKLSTPFDEAYQNRFNTSLAQARKGNYLISVSVLKQPAQTRNDVQEVKLTKDEMTKLLSALGKNL